jgi:hypothetical protein
MTFCAHGFGWRLVDTPRMTTCAPSASTSMSGRSGRALAPSTAESFGQKGYITGTDYCKHDQLTIRRDEVEARVLKALEEKLLNQELFEEFCDSRVR